VPELELSAGTVEYEDTGGNGPVVVLLHGLLMDNSQWRHLVADLRADYRCVAPTLPLGGHRRPMRPDADLSLPAQVRLVGEFLERLDLSDVTLVGIDTGGGFAQMLAAERPERIARMVLVSPETFDNYPPGVPGHAAWLAGQLPGGIAAALLPLRFRALRRLPMSFGWMSKRPVPDEVMDSWLRPAFKRREIRRDLRKYVRGARRDSHHLRAASERMSEFDRPVLVVWAREDRVMPPSHGRRLVDLLPQGRLAEIDDSYTLVTEDQPAELAWRVRQFLRDTAPGRTELKRAG
jgi:pimeloyl-ACP methyl ester carboxylesterase